MYKFTNGVVVYDKETRDKYIKAGMILVEEEPKKKESKNGESKIQSDTERSEFGKTSKRTGKFSRNFK
jgi:hypothetical protein